MAKAPTEIRSLARSHTDSAIKTLVGIMQQSDAAPAARVAAANSLLDRGWGKAETKSEITLRKASASDLSDNELASIAAGGGDNAAETPVDPSQLN